MKLFIAIDLEGISGVVSEADTAREGAAAQRARVHMRADLDAVLDGCAAGGAGEVVVCDAHDDGRNLDPAGLPDAVRLVGGSPTPLSMLEGLGPDCDGALFVGYHARAGTAAAVLEHTWNYKIFAVTVGDLEVGEFGLGALLAGHFGVPALYLSGDDKAAAEARALVPGIVTTVVKTGHPPRGGGLLPARGGARPPARRRRGGAPGGALAGAARLERRAAPAHLHARPVLRPGRDLPGRDAAGRAHPRDRRRVVRRRLQRVPRLSAAVGGGGVGRRAAGRPQLRGRRRCGQIMPSSGCGVAGNTSASQAEDRGFESRHPLQILSASVRASSRRRGCPCSRSAGSPLD